MSVWSNEKIRIFCVITQGELGGAQQFVAQLAQYINSDRFLLHVVWGSESGSALARHLPPQVSHAVTPHLVRAISPINDLKAIKELRAMMSAFRPDIVLCISSKAGFVGSRAAHGLRAQLPHMRVIYRIGGWTFNDPWPSWKKRLYVVLEKLSAHWKDTIVVNNTHDLLQAKSLGIRPRHQVTLIHNGIEPYLDFIPRAEATEALRAKMPERYRDIPYDWLVGTVANFYPAKDLTTLVRAAARVSKNVRFVVIGDGQLKQELQAEIARHDLADRFFLVGSIPQAYRYLQALDMFVLPSVKEGFPWSVLEAMAAKVPVIATRVGALPEMITDHVSGILVGPKNDTQIARSIVELVEDDKLRQDVAIRAHQELITRFSLRGMIAQYERLFSRE